MDDKAGTADVEAYLAEVAEPFRLMLEHIRNIIREEAPEATEAIAYGIPTFRLRRNLIHYAAFKNHCSLFPGAIVEDEALKSRLSGFKISKGTIQFTAGNPLPDDLVRLIVRMGIAREQQVEENRQTKRQKKPTSPAP